MPPPPLTCYPFIPYRATPPNREGLCRPAIDSPCECEYNNPNSLDARLFPSVVLAVAPAVTMDEAYSLSSATPPKMMMFTPERHLSTSGQHGPAPSGTPPPAQPPPPPQTRETQSHSAPTPLKRPMLTPEGGPRPRVKRLGTWTLVRPQKGADARIIPKGT